MRERALALNGKVEFESRREGAGTTIRLLIPQNATRQANSFDRKQLQRKKFDQPQAPFRKWIASQLNRKIGASLNHRRRLRSRHAPPINLQRGIP